jgi:hopanoid biosynthesis associated RND transporter like protein HpnN
LREGEDRVTRGLVRATKFALCNGRVVVLCVLLVTALASWLSVERLGFNLDPNDLFSKELRFQRMIAEFSEHFPVLTNSLLVVVDGATPEATRAAADAMLERLSARTDRFTQAYYPGEESFFETHGLLYNDIDDLDTFADSMARMQPVMAALSRDPSLASLSRVVAQGLEHWDPDAPDADTERWRSVLEHYANATISVYAEVPVSVSWESILLEGSPLDPTLRRVIVAHPILDFDRLLAAARPIEAIREAAENLPLASGERVTVRVTGYPALNHEEFLGLARDTSVAGTLSFLFVMLVLFVAFRSMSIVGAAALTLLVGFVWTAGYAAVVVERLNVVSIAVAVLFIGLGVDFLIHMGMLVVEALRRGESVEESVLHAVRSAGSALALCAVTTAVGFLAFLPTAFRGVSELGLITAGGMLAIVVLTLTLFPLTLCRVLTGSRLEAVRNRPPLAVRFPGVRRPAVVVSLALMFGAGSLFALPWLELETNIVKIRNPDTESVEAFEDLLEDAATTPWYLDMLAPNLEEAQLLAERVRGLDTVDFAVTLADYVPSDQEDKLDLLDDVAFMLDLPEGIKEREPLSVEEQIVALRHLVEVLDPELLDPIPGGLASSARQLRREVARFLEQVDREHDPAAAIADLDARLIAPLPQQFDRLVTNLETSEVTLESLPQGLVDRMLSADGTARVQVFALRDLSDRGAMVEFVESVRPIWEDITGLPVNLVESSYATWESLQEALAWAFGLVLTLLLLLWRRPRDVGMALIPLVLSVLLTAAASALLGWPLNFVNICVLPLLLGIGVDSGVHMVHRAHELADGKGELLESTTAQAVFFSAITTLASFGTLSLSAHQGIASLGSLLVVGMIFSLVGNLLVLPALLALGGSSD